MQVPLKIHIKSWEKIFNKLKDQQSYKNNNLYLKKHN